MNRAELVDDRVYQLTTVRALGDREAIRTVPRAPASATVEGFGGGGDGGVRERGGWGRDVEGCGEEGCDGESDEGELHLVDCGGLESVVS